MNVKGLLAVDVKLRRDAEWRDLLFGKRADESMGTIFLPAYPREGDRIHIGYGIFQVSECHWMWERASEAEAWMHVLVRLASDR